MSKYTELLKLAAKFEKTLSKVAEVPENIKGTLADPTRIRLILEDRLNGEVSDGDVEFVIKTIEGYADLYSAEYARAKEHARRTRTRMPEKYRNMTLGDRQAELIDLALRALQEYKSMT
jgi:hypothetical protein